MKEDWVDRIIGWCMDWGDKPFDPAGPIVGDAALSEKEKRGWVDSLIVWPIIDAFFTLGSGISPEDPERDADNLEEDFFICSIYPHRKPNVTKTKR